MHISLYRLVITPQQKEQEQIILTPEQQHYLKRVLRMGKGDRFVAMDGQGTSWLAEISETSAIIIESLQLESELPTAITMITALPKGNGYEEIIRCCTELGATTFIPAIADRTLLKPSSHKIERWRKIATEASEQSERQIVPTILEPVNFIDAIKTVVDSETDCYICVTRRDVPHVQNCLHRSETKKIAIATGPEGGWTEAEIESSIESGFQAVSLGRRILRAVTAPIVALSLATAAVEK